LPEREEDDGLDCEELEDGIVRSEKVFSGKVEEKQSVQCKTDADVVDYSDVQVAALRSTVQMTLTAAHTTVAIAHTASG